MKKYLFLFSVVHGLTSCGREEHSSARPKVEQQIPQLDSPEIIDSSALFCPEGSRYSQTEKMCVTEKQAIGPFTREMISLCKDFGGGVDVCEGPRWDRQFAARLRLDGRCPRGSVYSAERMGCVDDEHAYGPFRSTDVRECERRGGGPACQSMRWSLTFLPVRAAGGSANRRVFEFYGVRKNYDEVYDQVLKFYPAGRSNGCVAFMSTALRMSGTPVPLNYTIDGESVSLVTKPFARYLMDQLGWKKILQANDLRPGDVVLTKDDSNYPGYPAHTYMFYGWSNQASGIGWVIDNRDFIHQRNIFDYGASNFAPFAYALRSAD